MENEVILLDIACKFAKLLTYLIFLVQSKSSTLFTPSSINRSITEIKNVLARIEYLIMRWVVKYTEISTLKCNWRIQGLLMITLLLDIERIGFDGKI